LDAGAQDLGGISPHDEVNPDYPHPKAEELQAKLAPYGYELVQRLPIYSHYDGWLSDRLRTSVNRYR
jgi:FO synthase subunit 1